MTDRHVLEWGQIDEAARLLAARWREANGRTPVLGVFGVPRGGCVPAALVARDLGVPLVDKPATGVLVVDDLVDSGATRERYLDYWFDALYNKNASVPGYGFANIGVPVESDAWLVFPWEQGDESGGPADAVVRLLQFIGEDPNRPGLLETPARVLRALGEMTCGYHQDAAEVLARQFPDDYDEMVVVRGVEFTSLCEHHMLGFTGTVTLAYVPTPGNGVVGLSKLARLVDVYARRLQVQERLTMEIADAMETHLRPEGVGVVVTARHSCMACRGVRKSADMVTSALRGVLREKPEARAEFLALAGV